MSLKSSFEQEQRLLREKISDIESKLTNKQNEIKSLENKIHMLLQSEGSQKNELNFWNGKVVTLKRDLDFQQTFGEKMQEENGQLLADIDNLKRLLEQKEKDMNLSSRETQGLKEDNERLSRMYQLVQKEAFNNVDRLKKQGGALYTDQSTDKKAYVQKNDNQSAMPPTKGGHNMWRDADEGIGGRKP